MEGVKRRRLKFRCLFGGNEESPKRRTVQCWSPANDTSDPSPFKFEVGNSTSRQHNVKPMKRLSAKGISNESSAKKRSILAKLMGRGRVAAARPILKQERRLTENCSKGTALPGGERNEYPFNHHSVKIRTNEQQHIKASYKDPEASHVANQHYSLQSCAKKKLQIKESRNVHEIADSVCKFESIRWTTDSNSDLMLKFLKQPVPLFVKHLHDSQSTPSSSLCNHIAIPSPSNSVRHIDYHKGWKEEEETSTYQDPFAHQGNGDEALNYFSHRIHHSHKSSRVKLKGKEVCDSDIPPKKIAILQPNTTNANNVYHSFVEGTEIKECFSSVIDEGDSWKDKESPGEVRFSRLGCIDARETTKEMTGRMKESFESGHVTLFEYDRQGYFGDEMFHLPRSVSACKTGETPMPFRITFDQNDRLTSSLSNLSEPSLIREAKNRISERWKTTRMQEDAGMVGKGSMLGEMLSFPDKQMKPAELDRVMGLVAGNDEYLTNRSRSTSLPPSFHDPNLNMSVCHEADADEKVVVYSEPLNQGRRKVEGIFKHDEDIPSKKERYNKRCQASQCSNAATSEFGIQLSESDSSQTSTVTYFVNEGPPAYQPLISDVDNGATHTASLVNPMAGFEIEMSFGTSNKLNPELASCMVGGANSTWVDENSSSSQEPLTAISGGTVSIQLSGPESEYPDQSLKEVDNSSRFSVLEVPPTSDISSDSDTFKRLDSQLQELKKQLHLLKIDSLSTSNGLTPVQNANQSSVAAPEPVGWESSFLAHILQSSDTYDNIDNDPHAYTAPWHNVHHPTDPRLFYRIEKHFFGGATLSRSEKHLFYDYVEQTFIRTSKSMTANSWVSPEKREGRLTLRKFSIEDQVRKVVDEIDKEDDEINNKRCNLYRAYDYDKDPEWLQPTNEVDILGKVLAELILTDLVLEFIM